MIDEHDSRISSDWLASRKRTVILWGIPMLFIAAGIISGGLRPLLWSVGFLWIGALNLLFHVLNLPAHPSTAPRAEFSIGDMIV